MFSFPKASSLAVALALVGSFGLANVASATDSKAPAHQLAEGGSDRLIQNRVAEGGSDRLIQNRVAEGGADRLQELRERNAAAVA
ncbi:phage infection protein [Pseudomonas corrugata]|uniref:Phage infection protein n=1 Tax=Pseudomonas corrugata TaxID=47879 RepID=A0A8B6UXT0_9PSED|nr:phage infection protein [Pseudomonas corrugata]QTH16707.1 phage infection protein [Pseudomonas corrugata]